MASVVLPLRFGKKVDNSGLVRYCNVDSRFVKAYSR